MLPMVQRAERSIARMAMVALALIFTARGAVRAADAFAQPAAASALPAGALAGAASLYLREAASGPVRWQPWGENSFQLALKLKRPMLIDIGAVWCHWCHVMDQTTYANPEVADLINRRFVPIKVDADERPDVDAYYQEAADGFGAGGWPLSCFTTPDGAPLLIAGYMPARSSQERTGTEAGATRSGPHGYGMLYILGRLADTYARDPDFTKTAHDIAAKMAEETRGRAGPPNSSEAMRAEILHALDTSYNREVGGFGPALGPRFYDFPAIELALAHGFFGNPGFTATALDTLRKMAAGGVFDQLGGGFHRYSTDPAWRVPHFEKMAYDNAMAIAAYAHAYAATGDEEFARVARQTIAYVNANLLDADTHTFYSHQDADAFSGDDGSYYTWTRDEVRSAAGPAGSRAAMLYFGIDDDPARASDGRIVLRRALTIDQLAARLKLPRAQAEAALKEAVAAMRAARERRPHPKVDRAILVDRNAIMASAYLSAADALGDDGLRRIARDDLDYILAHLHAPDGSFYHAFANSVAEVPGLVADQVYMLGALAAAYQAFGDARYLKEARSLAELVMKSFRDSATGLLRNRDPAEKGTVLAAVKASPDVLLDHPTPSVQAAAAIAMRKLAALTGDDGYAERSSELLAAASGRLSASGGAMLGEFGLALEQRADGEAVIVVVGGGDAGARTQALRDAALRTYRPGKVVMVMDSSAAPRDAIPPAARAMLAAAAVHPKTPLAFVCAGSACAKPVSEPEALARLIRRFQVPVARDTVARDRGS